MLMEMTKSELEAARNVAEYMGDSDKVARIDEELRMNPPVRFSVDWEVFVRTEEGVEYIWVSESMDIRAMAKVIYRFEKTGRHVVYAKVMQSIPAPRWS